MPVPTPDRRIRTVTGLFDFSSGHGLEVGPLHRPLVSRQTADVSYVDVYPRERLAQEHACSPHIVIEDIPEIDFPLWDGERVRTIEEAAKDGAPFDWIYASHVIEHVPDVIGWLQQLEAISSDHGALILVVPDRRYTFDVHRPPTTVGEMLLAHDRGDTIPSVRAVYDHHRSAVSAAAPKLWQREMPGYDARIHHLAYVQRQLERTRAGEYVDCHVWTFTDSSFTEQVGELGDLGLTTWWVEALRPVPRNGIEFVVVLRRGERPADHHVDLPSRPDWLSHVKPAAAKPPVAKKAAAKKRAAQPQPPDGGLTRLRRRIRRKIRRWRRQRAKKLAQQQRRRQPWVSRPGPSARHPADTRRRG